MVAENPSITGIWQSIRTTSKRVGRQSVERLLPVGSGLRFQAKGREHALGNLSIQRLVLDHQHASAQTRQQGVRRGQMHCPGCSHSPRRCVRSAHRGVA